MAVHGTHNAVQDDRNEKILIYVNGDLFPRNEAKISVFDSGYLVGDGMWEEKLGLEIRDKSCILCLIVSN